MWGHTDSLLSSRHLEIVSTCKAPFTNHSGRYTHGWSTAGILKIPVNLHLLDGMLTNGVSAHDADAQHDTQQ